MILPSSLLLLLLGVQASAAAASEYDRGMALARSGKWAEAERSFRAGQSKDPRDKRFSLELAGIAFKRQDFADAKAHLRYALTLDPADAYANDFLATLYLLDDNLEAALKYWNRAGKPRIEEIKIEPELRLDPVLLDRAFTFSPASTLQLRDFRATRTRLQALEVFPSFRFELIPRSGPSFGLFFRAAERNGWGESAAAGLIGLLRGAPYQELRPEFFNLGRSAVNLTSLLRWDSQKRRAFAEISGPLASDPKWRYQFSVDGRNENWDISRTFRGADATGLNLHKMEAAAELQSIASDRWSWKAGVHLANRSFRSAPSALFPDGVSLKYRAAIHSRVLAIPERRLAVESDGSVEVGRMFAESFGAFSKAETSLLAHWLPRARGDDYEMSARLRAGKSFGAIPFDELFILGLERDNNLWLRAHIGTRDGRKGNAPLGRDYALLNWEFDKNIYRHSLFALKLGPFVDSGRAYANSQGFGSQQWLWDTGAQCKLRTLAGVTFVFSYGKDLRSGHNAFYTMVTR